MGQKLSCFGECVIPHFMGRKKSKTTRSETQILESTNSLPDDRTILVSQSKITGNENAICPNFFSMSSESTMLNETPVQNVKLHSQVPDFEIKDKTLILVPSKEEALWSSSLASKPHLCLLTRDLKCNETENDTSTTTAEDTYHHELPYIPPRPKINFLEDHLCNEGNQELNGELSLSKSTAPVIQPRKPEKINSKLKSIVPDIPPRKHEKFRSKMMSVVPDIPPTKRDNINSISMTVGSNSSSIRSPPDIPPRKFENKS